MNILILMGSPRKKDGYSVCKLIENKINERNQRNQTKFEYVYLKSLNIEDCRGCSLCFHKGENYCPIEDDLKTIKQKLINADGIIFVSPVYACQITGSFKRMIERFSYLFHRPELVGKPALTIVTTAGGGQKAVTKYLKMTACGWGCNLTGSIEIISPMFFKEDGNNRLFKKKYFDKKYKNIEKLTTNFYETIQSKRLPVPGFYEIYMFNGLRSKTYTSMLDYKYWDSKGWLDSTYYYDINISKVKKLFGSFINKIIKYMWEKMQSE
ncbi:flavodoxin family protein [Clostridium brassicae]|uniref:Flavodoxin family protein n=1 Tax=Clostridium brassicae TaxID=2999072 RepID=A0ABT4DC61_9CLOT|nr:flavodoxin family protein [Clostridium brassicae]MCY6959895.1 flavodoxin family protein [Clostridium brassicae]